MKWFVLISFRWINRFKHIKHVFKPLGLILSHTHIANTLIYNLYNFTIYIAVSRLWWLNTAHVAGYHLRCFLTYNPFCELWNNIVSHCATKNATYQMNSISPSPHLITHRWWFRCQRTILISFLFLNATFTDFTVFILF